MPGSRSSTPAESRTPRAGDQIADRYELEELCGSGGMSLVFRAHDVQLDRPVAVKILLQRYADDAEYVERFLREARAVARLSHPNLVTVIDRGEDEGHQFIVFEFVEGENLKELIRRNGPLPVRRAVELVLAVADGLAFAHVHGLVHRDVKPQNILVSTEGEVKVTDFGIARSLEVEGGVTQTGAVLGTGEYIAPEQASGKPVSAATDVYSLGIVLWELLTGDVPFAGENFVAVALRHVNEPAPILQEHRPDVPRRLAAAVERALRKDPALRFPSMAAFAQELRNSLEEPDSEGATMVIPARARTPAAPRRPARRRGPFPLGYLVVAGLAATAALVAALLLAGSSHHGGKGGAASGGGGGAGASVPLRGITTYDPQGGEQQALGYTAAYATDGSAGTTWKTEIYATEAFGNLKSGLGLVVASGSSVALSSVTVSSPTPGFVARIEVGTSPSGPFVSDSASQTVGARTTFTLSGKSGSYWVVWITRLGPQLTARISEVSASR